MGRRKKYKFRQRGKRLTPYQLQKDNIDLRTRIALSLIEVCKYPVSTVYQLLFGEDLKPNSLAPTASRWYNSIPIQDLVDLYRRYYEDIIYSINEFPQENQEKDW